MSHNTGDAVVESEATGPGNAGAAVSTKPDAFRQLESAIDAIGTNSVHLRLFLIVALGGLFNLIEQYNIGYAGPLIVEQWGLGSGAIGALSMATFLAMAVGSVLTGLLADKYGRKPLFIANVLVYSLGSLLAAFAPDFTVLLIARAVVGIGLGGEMALGYTMISELMPTSKRGASSAAMSLMHGGVGIWASAALAALILGPLATVIGGPEAAWRVLLGIMVVPAVLVLIARRYMPETPRYMIRMGRVEETNRVLSAISQKRMRLSPGTPAEVFIAEDAFVPEDKKVRIGELFSKALLGRTLIGWILAITLFACVASLTTFLPSIVVALGYDPAGSAGLATLITLGGVVGGVAGIFAGHKFPRRWVLLVCSAANVAMALTLAAVQTTMLVVVLGFVIALSLQVLSGSFWGYLPELYPTRLRALGVSLATTVALALGASIGPSVAGNLLEVSGPGPMFVLIAVLAAVHGLVALMGPETHRRPLTES